MLKLEPVDTPVRPTTTTYHGQEVTEGYRWLEDGGAEDTRRWTDAQDARTRHYLDSLPHRPAVGERVRELLAAESVSYDRVRRGGSTYFALKTQPPLQQPFLVVLDRLEDAASERVLVDPNRIDESGATTIDWFVPSPDGSRVAVSLSEKGTEDGVLHVIDVSSGQEVDSRIPGVNSGTAGGSLAWRGDASGFWYTRHPRAGERPDADLGFYQDVWFHEVGAAHETDSPDLSGVFADDKIAENFLTASGDGRWVADMVQKGDGGEWQLFLRSQEPGATWRQVTDLADKCVAIAFGADALYLLSLLGAPHGQVLRLPLTGDVGLEDAEVVVPHSDLTIEIVAATDRRLWVAYLDGGPSTLRGFDSSGAPLPDVEVPPVSSVEPLVALGDDEVAWAVETFLAPRSWWVQHDDEARPRRTALDSSTPVDFSGVEVERLFATSADGTQVPVSVLARRGTPRDGSAPAVLYGYGGYAIPVKPFFDPAWLLWLEQGGVYAVANIRGGGEYGEEWHHAGRLDRKQNCFDDFAACADHLVASGITRRARLAIMGGSNGGLLMGAVLTQRPDVATAVVAAVPIMDSLRSELTPNGEFNVTEFGTVAEPDMFRALLAYSPYHNVRDDTAYPSVLITAGEFDPRVDAWHAKKMTARLQAATSSEEPVLLRMEAGGHGIGQSLDDRVALWADIYAFLLDRLDVPYERR